MLSKALLMAALILGLSGIAMAQTDPHPTGTTPTAASTERRSLSPTREEGLGTTKDNGDVASSPKTAEPSANFGTSMPPKGSSPGASSGGTDGSATPAATGR
jgi:hypothetical protein